MSDTPIALHGTHRDNDDYYFVVHDGMKTSYRKSNQNVFTKVVGGDGSTAVWAGCPEVSSVEDAHEAARTWLNPANAPDRSMRSF